MHKAQAVLVSQEKRLTGMPVSLIRLQKNTFSRAFVKPSGIAGRLDEVNLAACAGRGGYCAGLAGAADFLCTGLGLMSFFAACGFTTVSSTGVVPVTSVAKSAPEGTR